jgi:predicted transcriptional regulator
VTSQNRRDQILNFVMKNPGYHFRGIQRALRVPTGVLQYHLNLLIKDNEIITREINGTTCYFPNRTLKEEQFIIFSHLRNGVRNRILRVMLDGRARSPSELLKEVTVSAPTLSYHLSLMVEDGILEKILLEKGVGYRIKDLELFRGLILAYKESFADRLIQDFISLWDR